MEWETSADERRNELVKNGQQAIWGRAGPHGLDLRGTCRRAWGKGRQAHSSTTHRISLILARAHLPVSPGTCAVPENPAGTARQRFAHCKMIRLCPSSLQSPSPGGQFPCFSHTTPAGVVWFCKPAAERPSKGGCAANSLAWSWPSKPSKPKLFSGSLPSKVTPPVDFGSCRLLPANDLRNEPSSATRDKQRSHRGSTKTRGLASSALWRRHATGEADNQTLASVENFNRCEILFAQPYRLWRRLGLGPVRDSALAGSSVARGEGLSLGLFQQQ